MVAHRGGLYSLLMLGGYFDGSPVSQRTTRASRFDLAQANGCRGPAFPCDGYLCTAGPSSPPQPTLLRRHIPNPAKELSSSSPTFNYVPMSKPHFPSTGPNAKKDGSVAHLDKNHLTPKRILHTAAPGTVLIPRTTVVRTLFTPSHVPTLPGAPSSDASNANYCLPIELRHHTQLP